MRTSLIAIAVVAVVAGPVAAQVDRVSLGGGVGITVSGDGQGKAYHGAVSVPVRPLRTRAHLRAEVMYQAGTASSSPFKCERVDPFYCLGRTDENQVAAAAIFVRLQTRWIGMWRFYLDPIGAGVYHRRTRSTETQAPTAICFIGGQIVSCPSNPDWATFEYRLSRTSVGANSGAGFEFQFEGMLLFAEARAHTFFESGRRESAPGALPVTFGIKF